MQTPSLKGLSDAQRWTAHKAARILEQAGHRAWLVGGAVRDLALGQTPKDIDLATDALPEQVEAAFEHSIAVGKAFGTIVVLLKRDEDSSPEELQVTTLRRDGVYRDGRHPGEVLYSNSVEEDAQRRDFTCNALFLDLQEEEFLDPTGGLEDLTQGRLRCVGDPMMRFSEDGLRLLRLARFAAAFELEVEERTWVGACASLEALAGVSPERVLGEFSAMAQRPHPDRALALLHSSGVLQRVFWNADRGPWQPDLAPRLAQLKRLGDAPGTRLFLAVLFWEEESEQQELGLARLKGLRPSRELLQAVQGIWSLCRSLLCLAREAATALDIPSKKEAWQHRAQLIRLKRSLGFPAAQAFLATRDFASDDRRHLDRLDSELEALAGAELHPEPFLQSRDLAAARIPPGPRWGELLRQAEERQLGQKDRGREEALAWLRTQV